jgi:outer membrane protein assembly factor BamA
MTAVRRKVNAVLDPSAGGVVQLSLEYASRFVGSDTLYEFNRGELEIEHYYPISRRGVFAWRVQGGALLPQRISLSGQSARFVPPDQRFYGGGPNSVRGYARNELGPLVYVTSDTNNRTVSGGDTTYAGVVTAPTGGNALFVMSAELRFATPFLPDRLRLGLFVDAGQVWERRTELISFGTLRVTPGFGVRYATPLGPVRLDAAYKGYANEPGPLFLSSGATLTRVRDSYHPRRPDALLRRITLQFAVGQAF